MSKLNDIQTYNLRDIRKDLKMTQLDVAIMLGISRVTYNKYEQDVNSMPMGSYRRIIEVFNKLYELRSDIYDRLANAEGDVK